MIQKPPHGADPPRPGLIDFSSNLHPSPAPEPILNAARAGVDDAAHYPDLNADSVRACFSERLDLPQEQILFGPGSSHLLYLILSILKPRTVLIPTPCFSEYPYAAQRAGGKILEYPGAMELDRFGEISSPPKIPPHTCVILSNPCNPTGKIIPAEIIQKWMTALRDAEGHLIVDEAYTDFRETGAEKYDSKIFDTWPLIVLRSSLKFFTLPGLRSGMAILPAELAERAAADIPPWPLSTPAIAATLATLDLNPGEIHDRRRQVRGWADTFQKAVRTVPGLSIVPSDIHFFMIRLPEAGPDGISLARQLAQEGLWIRTHAGMPGLTAHDIRVSTRFPEENGKFISALKKLYRPTVPTIP